jgi:hypothetical protein
MIRVLLLLSICIYTCTWQNISSASPSSSCCSSVLESSSAFSYPKFIRTLSEVKVTNKVGIADDDSNTDEQQEDL